MYLKWVNHMICKVFLNRAIFDNLDYIYSHFYSFNYRPKIGPIYIFDAFSSTKYSAFPPNFSTYNFPHL